MKDIYSKCCYEEMSTVKPGDVVMCDSKTCIIPFLDG